MIERNNILKLARKHYEAVGCAFSGDDREVVEYLYDSQHPDEERCLSLAIEAHNIYCDDDLYIDGFFEWHGF